MRFLPFGLPAASLCFALLIPCASLAAAPDSDGDGLTDAEERSRVRDARFNPRQPVMTSGGIPYSVFAADLDGDGDRDAIAAFGDQDDEIAWSENRLDEASADFGPKHVISIQVDYTSSVFAADLDGDGDPDVLSASRGDQKIAWYENRLDEASADFGEQQVISIGATSPRSIFVVDLDGDGDPDVLSVFPAEDLIAWYQNRLESPQADFGPQRVISTLATDAVAVFAADLDGDGDADALSAGSYSYGHVAWYRNRLDTPSADFGPRLLITSAIENPFDLIAADLDGDQRVDVLSAYSWERKIAWFENRLDVGGFGDPEEIGTLGSGPRGILAADLDGDDDPDVVAAAVTGGAKWFENHLNEPTADFHFPRVISFTGDALESIAAADLDGDGDQDLLTGFRSGEKIGWYENPGTNPLDPDTDDDGLSDGIEVNREGTDPGDPDSDDDGLTDGDEVDLHRTDPRDEDTDGDGLLDGFEVANSFDPRRGGEATQDPDQDGLDNLGEQSEATDPHDPDSDDDGALDGAEVAIHLTDPHDPDSDDDGLLDGDEVNLHGTNPLDPDSDGDHLSDSDEVNLYPTDPLDPDTDGEGLNDHIEIAFHTTNPVNADTDGDTFDDDREVRAGSDPKNAASTPGPSQPTLYEASLIIHAYGSETTTTAMGPPQIVSHFLALPLGYDCRDGRPQTPSGATASHYCTSAILEQGRPVTGSGVVGLGAGATKPILLPQSAFAASGVTGFHPVFTYSYPYSKIHSYATIANAAGTLFAGGGAAAGKRAHEHTGPWPASWVVREGENGFGGTLRLLGKLGANEAWASWSTGCGSWTGTNSWNMIPALGRSQADAGNPNTITATFTSKICGGRASPQLRGSGTPWTTGSVTVYATQFFRATTIRRAGYDNRDAFGNGTIQLVTPGLTHWGNAGTSYRGHVAVLKLKFVPEPRALPLLIAGAAALAWRCRTSGRRRSSQGS
jgi:hypothetical protein